MPSSVDRYIILASTSLAGYIFSRFSSQWCFVLIDDITVRHGRLARTDARKTGTVLNDERAKFHTMSRWFMLLYLSRIEFYRNKIQERRNMSEYVQKKKKRSKSCINKVKILYDKKLRIRWYE